MTISSTNRSFSSAKSGRFRLSCIGQTWVYSFSLSRVFQNGGQYTDGHTEFTRSSLSRWCREKCFSLLIIPAVPEKMVRFGLHIHPCHQGVRKLWLATVGPFLTCRPGEEGPCECRHCHVRAGEFLKEKCWQKQTSTSEESQYIGALKYDYKVVILKVLMGF